MAFEHSAFFPLVDCGACTLHALFFPLLRCRQVFSLCFCTKLSVLLLFFPFFRGVGTLPAPLSAVMSGSGSGSEGTFQVRDLETKDLTELMSLLSHLTKVDELTSEQLHALFDERVRTGIVTKVVVDTSNGSVVGTGSLVVERKFTRGGRCVGHIEDVVTDLRYRGRGVGALLMRDLCAIAKDRDCYKVILDCTDANVPFYERYGFVKCENQMRLDLS